MSKKLIYFLVGLLAMAILVGGCGQQTAKKDEAKVLRVGTEPTFAPFEFQEENSKDYTGFDMDLIRAIGKEMGYKVEIQNMGFDGLIPALESGQIDVVASAMSITPERQQKIQFSAPYYKSGLSIVVAKNNNDIQGLKDLEGKKIAVQIGNTGAEEAKKISGAIVHEFNTTTEAYLELKNGGADAVLLDAPVNDYYLAKTKGENAKMVGGLLNAEDYGFAVSKKNAELAGKIDQALATLKSNGQYEKIYMKWFNKKPEKK